jgi:SAM-dependent methyltransferase
MTEAAGIRFAFGANWQSFAAAIDPARIAEAEAGLRRLFPAGEIEGCRFLDIGCGSGLSALAALRLGAAHVSAIDLDPRSAATTRSVLQKYAKTASWDVQQKSVFDLMPASEAPHGIVYSWGVLHHTGRMWEALERCCALVPGGGRLAVALYRRTPMCGFWRAEKRFYAAAGPAAQKSVRALYKVAYGAGLLATGRNPARYVASYQSARGMDWHHDVHDWLGGYPYESTDPAAVRDFLARHGFALDRMFERPAAAKGLFGSHCDEYVAVRSAGARPATVLSDRDT